MAELRAWTRPSGSTRLSWPNVRAAQGSITDVARTDRHRCGRHAARRRRARHAAHPPGGAGRGGLRCSVRVGDGPPAAVDPAGRRGAGFRPDGGVRQRRGDLRPRPGPHHLRAHLGRRRAHRARRDRHPGDSGGGPGRRARRPQRARLGDATVRQLARLRARLAQPGQHRGLDRGSTQRAGGEAADPQGGCA